MFLIIEDVCFSYRAALVSQLSVTQQALALFDERVFLPVVQILQLVDVILALRLSLLHVDVGKHTLHDGDLQNTRSQNISFYYQPSVFLSYSVSAGINKKVCLFLTDVNNNVNDLN